MNNRSLDKLQLFSGVPWMVVFSCEAVFILIGNAMTIYIFWSIRKRLKRTSYLLINLAVGDFLVGVSIALFLWYHIVPVEKVRITAMVVSIVGTLCSLLSMTLISLERMCAILWPFRHRTLSLWSYHISVGIVWFMTISLATLTLSIDLFNISSDLNFVTAIIIFCTVAVIGGAYFTIWISTRKIRMPGRTDRSIEQDRRLAKTLFLVTALSIITFLPYGIIYAVTVFNPQEMFSFWVDITLALQLLNSFLNPIVYCFKMPEFKECLNNLLCRCSGQRLSGRRGETTGVTLRSIKAIDTL